jgi:hypothetical protein
MKQQENNSSISHESQMIIMAEQMRKELPSHQQPQNIKNYSKKGVSDLEN